MLTQNQKLKLSVIVPVRNEEACIESTLRHLSAALAAHSIDHEILVVNDHSTDRSEDVVLRLIRENPSIRMVQNAGPRGFGLAVRTGLDRFTGEAAAIFMGDESDSAADLVAFFQTMLRTNADCVFGSRFMAGGRITGYPPLKMLVNRAANMMIRCLFGLRYNDTTNAFKLYRRHVIEELRPFSSRSFNLSLELSLTAIIRGYRYQVVPNIWTDRKAGKSKFKILEVGPAYLRVVLHCFMEKWFHPASHRR